MESAMTNDTSLENALNIPTQTTNQSENKPLWPRADNPPSKQRKINIWLSFAIGLVLGAVFIILTPKGTSIYALIPKEWTHWIFNTFPDWLAIVIAILPILLLFRVYLFVIDLIHELGHWVAGALVGFKAILLQVHPFRLWNYAGRWKLSKSGGSIFSAFASSLPQTNHLLAERWMVMILGGPMANLLTAAVLVMLMRWMPEKFPLFMIHFLNELASFSLIVGVLNLLPLAPAVDGARLLDLIRGGFKAERQVAQITLGAQQLAGLPAEQWDVDKLDYLIQHPRGDISDLTDHYLSYVRHSRLYQDDLAQRDLESLFAMLERVPVAARGIYWIEAAHFSASVRHDLASAKAALECVPVNQRKALKISMDSALAYMLCLEGKWEEAEAMAQSVVKRFQAIHPEAIKPWYERFIERGIKDKDAIDAMIREHKLD
jgi:hypothetical protein